MNVIIGVLITFLVVILVLYLVNMLPIDGRAKQIVRDQFVKRITNREHDILVKLDRGEHHDRSGDNCTAKLFCERREPHDLAEG